MMFSLLLFESEVALEEYTKCDRESRSASIFASELETRAGNEDSEMNKSLSFGSTLGARKYGSTLCYYLRPLGVF
ncbi:floral homeotic protein APETALA 2-like protein [Corchorus olitorius]|uniref:Floral homeotic protein APETALA 2-like protein n=1 Tax=Corchorus olitorius TaxID=93759 RepID=A0A1R3L0L5_9ROSI|nr:floral homeotic protein APETALA 2-like protein [Corchorus olitorius]